jgi:hypothetical protein
MILHKHQDPPLDTTLSHCLPHSSLLALSSRPPLHPYIHVYGPSQSLLITSALKMETAHFSEMLAFTKQPTRRPNQNLFWGSYLQLTPSGSTKTGQVPFLFSSSWAVLSTLLSNVLAISYTETTTSEFSFQVFFSNFLVISFVPS